MSRPAIAWRRNIFAMNWTPMTHVFGRTVVALRGGHLPAAQTVMIMPVFLLGICSEHCLYRDPAGFAVWSNSLVVRKLSCGSFSLRDHAGGLVRGVFSAQ